MTGLIPPRLVLRMTIVRGITVLNPPPQAYVGTAYSHRFNIYGGTPPYAFELRSVLPAGWAFDEATGTVTAASPLVTDVVTLALYVRDSEWDYELEQTFVISVVALPLIVTNSAPNGTVATPYSFAYATSGGAGAVTFSIQSGALPPGLSLSSGGLLSGAPTTGGSYSYVVAATDSAGTVATRTETIAIAYAPLAVSGSFAYGITTSSVVGSQVLSGGASPYSVSVLSGALPPGIAFVISGSSCVASGICLVIGTYSFTLRYTSNDGQHVDVPMSIRVPYYAPLFASNETGVVLDFQDLTTMFQNAAGTMPVTTIGQPIYSIKDRVSGSLCVFTGAAPTLQYDSTHAVYYAQFPSGGAAHGTVPVPITLAGNASKSIVAVCTLGGPTVNETPLLYGANAFAGCFAIGNGDSIMGGFAVFEQGSGHGIGGASIPAGSYAIIATKNGNNLAIYTDQTSGYSGTVSGPASITNNALNVGYYPSLAGVDFKGRMYSAILLSRVVSTSERNDISTDHYS